MSFKGKSLFEIYNRIKNPTYLLEWNEEYYSKFTARDMHRFMHIRHMENLGISKEDIDEVAELGAKAAREHADTGTCVLGGGLLADKKNPKSGKYPSGRKYMDYYKGDWILKAFAQGNLGCESWYQSAKDYLEPKYPDIDFKISWGRMD